MDDGTDKAYITSEFLRKWFYIAPSKSSGQVDEEQLIKNKYIQFRQNLNSRRAKSGLYILCDRDIRMVFEEYEKAAEGQSFKSTGSELLL